MNRNSSNYQSNLVPRSKRNHPIYGLLNLLNLCRSRLDETELEKLDLLTVNDILCGKIDQRLVEKLSKPAKEGLSSNQTTLHLIMHRRPYSTACNLVAGADSGTVQTSTGCRITALEAELAMLHSSISWRVTAPLRAISKMLRRW